MWRLCWCSHSATVFLEELLEGEWSSELIGGAEDDVGHVAEFVEDVDDVVVMQLAERWIGYAEELVADIESRAAGVVGRRLG